MEEHQLEDIVCRTTPISTGKYLCKMAGLPRKTEGTGIRKKLSKKNGNIINRVVIILFFSKIL